MLIRVKWFYPVKKWQRRRQNFAKCRQALSSTVMCRQAPPSTTSCWLTRCLRQQHPGIGVETWIDRLCGPLAWHRRKEAVSACEWRRRLGRCHELEDRICTLAVSKERSGRCTVAAAAATATYAAIDQSPILLPPPKVKRFFFLRHNFQKITINNK